MTQQVGKHVLAHTFHDEAEHQTECKDEHEDLQRVAQSRLPDGALVALFIVVLLVAVHLVGMAGVAAPQPLGQDAAQHKVQHETNDDSVHHLDDHQHDQLVPVGRHGHQQRDGFIAGGQIHGHQGAQRNNAGRIKVGRNGREAALRHTAQQGTGHCAPAPAAGQQRFDALAVAVLDVFDQQIGQKQKGQHLGGVHQRFAQNIQKQFHKYCSQKPQRVSSF